MEIAHRTGSSPAAVSMRLTRGARRTPPLAGGRAARGAESFGLTLPTTDTWVHTRVHCTQCGLGTLLMRIERAPGTIAFRCPRCDPSPSAGPWSSRSPTRPSPAAGRTGAADGHPAARRCVVARLLRGGPAYGPRRTRCGSGCACRPTSAMTCRPSSTGGAVRRLRRLRAPGLHLGERPDAGPAPSARFRRAHPRLRAMPPREVEAHGGPAVVVGTRRSARSARLEAVFAADSLRLLEVTDPR